MVRIFRHVLSYLNPLLTYLPCILHKCKIEVIECMKQCIDLNIDKHLFVKAAHLKLLSQLFAVMEY